MRTLDESSGGMRFGGVLLLVPLFTLFYRGDSEAEGIPFTGQYKHLADNEARG